MKVLFDLFPVSFSHLNGVFVYAQRILEGWHKCGIKDVTILTTTELKDFLLGPLFPDYQFITIDPPKNKRYTIKCLLSSYKRLKAINSSGCDIVFYPMPEPFFFQTPSIPQVSVIHDMAQGMYRRYQTAVLLPWQRFHFAKMITISNYTKSLVLKQYKWMKKDKLRTIYNAVPYSEIKYPRIIQDNYILNVNTLHKYKNVDTLIRALGLIKNETELKLVIVGNNINNRWEELINIAKTYGIESRLIHMQGVSNEELISLYQHASLFVTPSTIEGFGQTPIEAAMYECPVISSTMTALPEATQGLVNYYEPVLSEQALASKILHVINNPQSKEALSLISNRMKDEYDICRQSLKVYDVLESVFNNRKC